MTLGIPITTISGGIKPDSSVILNPRNTMVASDARIPINITIRAKNTTCMDLKKNNKMSEVTKMAKPRKIISSLVTCEVYSVRIKGIPEK